VVERLCRLERYSTRVTETERNLAALERLVPYRGWNVIIKNVVGGEHRRVTGSPYGYTLIHVFLNQKNRYAIRLLLERGANPNMKAGCFSMPLLHYGVEEGDEAIVLLLLKNGALVEGRDGLTRTALMISAAAGREEMVRLLLENGADIGAKDCHQRTALSYAEKAGKHGVIKILNARHS
jgi:ankyrin repeat protein